MNITEILKALASAPRLDTGHPDVVIVSLPAEVLDAVDAAIAKATGQEGGAA